ncbi:MAG: IgGFc-binding protein, partial [Myxococcota bacterium]|nr:IgGFc-binding protein [Myxococcota bacterium]
MRVLVVILSLSMVACFGGSGGGGRRDAAGMTTGSGTGGGTTASDGATSSTDTPDLKECSTDNDCPSDKPSCAPQGVCIFCYPGTYQCEGDVSLVCSQFGEAYEVNQDCAANGGTCNPLGGKCESACGGGGGVSKTNAGCDFVAVDLENAVAGSNDAQNAQFAIIASNTSTEGSANVTVTMPDGQTVTKPVSPQSLEKFELPPTWSLSGTSITNSAYRVTSDRPITLYQFNPLSNVGVFSNDASVLLPTASNGNEYYVVTKPSTSLANGYFVIVATSDGETEVTFTPKAATAAGGDVPTVAANASHTVTLTKNQVLSVTNNESGSDLSGTIIRSNKPISVMSGHTASNESDVGTGKCCADHLEAQVPPVNAWAKEYIIGRSKPRGAEGDYLRVVASQDNTTVNLTPAVTLPSSKTLNAGDVWAFRTNTDVKVSGDKPIMVAQILASSHAISKHGEFCTPGITDCGFPYTCVEMDPFTQTTMCMPPSCTTVNDCPESHACTTLDPSGFAVYECTPIGDPALIVAVPVAQWQT